MKKIKASYYMAAVFLAGVLALIYLSQSQTQPAEPKIKLSYFKTNLDVAESIAGVLKHDLKTENQYWFGIEPGAARELEIFKDLKALIEKQQGSFDFVFLDQELKLSETDKSLFGDPLVQEIRDDWGGMARQLQAHADKKILVITAAIYSTNLISANPISKIKTATKTNPVTISMGYFAIKPTDEKNIIFPCMTDDKEGISGWGCLLVNKARSQRRRVDMSKTDAPSSMITGLMDLTGEKDYMVLVR